MRETAVVEHIGQLKPDPKNARKHNPRNIGVIEDALHEVGAARSIVIDEDNVILAGNGVVEAAAQAGIERVQVVEADGNTLVAVRRSGLTAAQKQRLALYDNRAAELAEWDAGVLAELQADDEKLLQGLFDKDELDELLKGLLPGEAKADPGAQVDKAAELQEKWQTARGQVWQVGRHRLMCGDSTSAEDVARLMSGERATLMATDPPYLVDYQGGNHPQSWQNKPDVKDKHWDEYHEADGPEFFIRYLRVALDVALAERAAIYQWHAALRQKLVQEAWEAVGLLVHQQIIWVKARPVLTRSHYMWQHEPCFYGWVKGRQPVKKPPANAKSVWEVDQQGESNGIHPTQKPTELIRRPIEYHTERDELCYEPFSGSGTCLVAAEQTGRRCYALELEPSFVAVALERLAGMGLEPRLLE